MDAATFILTVDCGDEPEAREAAYSENEPLVDLLLAKRADPNLRNDAGQIPLEQTRTEGKNRIVAHLCAPVLK